MSHIICKIKDIYIYLNETSVDRSFVLRIAIHLFKCVHAHLLEVILAAVYKHALFVATIRRNSIHILSFFFLFFIC